MALYLTEADVTSLLTMEMALAAVEGVFRRQAEGAATNEPRRRVRSGGATLHVLSGADEGWLGLKAYTVTRHGARFLVSLYSAETGELVALLEADRLGQMRTGAASGVATRFLAQPAAQRVGIYGTGWQAESQLLGVCAVRPVTEVRVYSRSAEHRDHFCERMAPQLRGVHLLPVDRPEAVTAGAEILITITSAREPVLLGEWVEPGTHLNAAGGNSVLRREFDEGVVRRAGLLVVDSVEQARLEAGELIQAVEKGVFPWERVVELRKVAAGHHPGRQSAAEITVFKSLGLAIEDVATAVAVVKAAREQQRGREF